jgi:hypothetical protein
MDDSLPRGRHMPKWRGRDFHGKRSVYHEDSDCWTGSRKNQYPVLFETLPRRHRAKCRCSFNFELYSLKPILDDELWTLIQPLLPPKPRRAAPGTRAQTVRRSRRADWHPVRAAVRYPVEMLPQEMGYGSCMSCWRRLRDWKEAGSGTGCTKCCWPDCAPQIASTGHASSSIPPPFVLWDQVKSRTQSHQSRSTRFNTSPRHRSVRYPARADPDGHQPS